MRKLNLLLTLLVVGCGGSGVSSNPYAGNWAGTLNGQPVSLTINQSGYVSGSDGKIVVNGNINQVGLLSFGSLDGSIAFSGGMTLSGSGLTGADAQGDALEVSR